ncbi:rhodanese-like domain-containing protein [Vibrio lamellibrachiae]|uniref:rhodanese-like domain-containing protein n=1 Tax=Vibrio lamellibrachiae TaxID=2910253 RepID=UPI003D0A12A1
MSNKLSSLLLLLSLFCGFSFFAVASERADIGWEKVSQGAVLIDVRTPDEFQQGHLEGALLRPLQEIDSWYSKLPKDTDIVLYCRSGRRSGVAFDHLQSLGFSQVHNAGGYQEMLQSKP